MLEGERRTDFAKNVFVNIVLVYWLEKMKLEEQGRRKVARLCSLQGRESGELFNKAEKPITVGKVVWKEERGKEREEREKGKEDAFHYNKALKGKALQGMSLSTLLRFSNLILGISE